MFKYLLNIFISILIGALFLFSAYSKIIDLDPFEWTIAEMGLFNFKVSNAIARLLIGLEIFIGIAFIFQVKNKNVLYKIAAALLLIFNIYLAYIIITYGNNGNCGCFGKLFAMKPSEAILKNIAIILGIALLAYLLNIKKMVYDKAWAFYSLGLCAILAVNIYNPPEFIYINEVKKFTAFNLDLEPLYKEAASSPTIDYKKGKQIISIMSLHCPFCKKAARKMHSMLIRDASLPLYNIYGGDSASLKLFLKETQAQNIPYTLSNNEATLMKASQGHLPAILWVDNGKVVKSTNYYELDGASIKKWINKK